MTENPDGSVTITANATDEDGDPVRNHPVDGKTVGSGVTNKKGIASMTRPAAKIGDGIHRITVVIIYTDDLKGGIFSLKFTRESKKDINNTNDTNNTTDKLNNNSVAVATMNNTGMPIIAILLVLLSALGISIYRKQN